MASGEDGVPNGVYSLSLGDTFTRDASAATSSSAQFDCIRYDFQPPSVASGAETYVGFEDNKTVTVAVSKSGEQDSAGDMLVYKGSQKPAKEKECLLIFDKETKTFRLEQVRSNIHVKRVRSGDLNTAGLKQQIHQLKQARRPDTEEVALGLSASKKIPLRNESDATSRVPSEKVPETINKIRTKSEVLQNDLQLSESSDDDMIDV